MEEGDRQDLSRTDRAMVEEFGCPTWLVPPTRCVMEKQEEAHWAARPCSWRPDAADTFALTRFHSSAIIEI